MTKKERERRQALRLAVAHAGSYATCPNGHPRVQLRAVVTKTSRRLEVWCNEPGCGKQEVINQERVA